VAATAGTIAVLGSGIDRVYPRCHTGLADEIAAAGVIVSEYAPGTPARRHHFPDRNRVIAALGLGTLVIEATRRSGSLITAKRALDYGREVFAVPGSIHSPLASGCHWLLRQGAALVEQHTDVLVEVAPMIDFEIARLPASEVAAETSTTADDPLCKLLNLIDFAPVTIEDLLADAGLTTAEVSSMLLMLELEGHVEALPGGRYCRLVKRS
jgi:DNA processing protein